MTHFVYEFEKNIIYINFDNFLDLADRYNYDFLPFYAAVGIINAAFLIIYVLINLSKLMKFSTRSIEEIFGFFITLAFCKDALKHLSSTFDHYYYDYHLFNATVSESVSLASVFDGNALNSQNDPASFPDWISSCATANFTDSQEKNKNNFCPMTFTYFYDYFQKDQ
jgi:hypothetical protein